MCLFMRVTKRRMCVQVSSLFDQLHGRPVGVASLINKNIDVPGLGCVYVARLVDCMGAMCPRPQLLTMKVVGEIDPGDVIEVVLDNPAAVEGFPALSQALNCTYLTTVRDVDHWRVYLRKNL